jgi:hypothetical protein
MEDSTRSVEIPELIGNLFRLLEAHRRAFQQERPYWRAAGLVMGELFNFGRQTVTQELLALGMNEGDWSAWYRLFSEKRFEEEGLCACLLKETLEHVDRTAPYVVAVDSTSLHRSSLTMPGTSWLRDARFSAFRPGIHRAQRFVHGAWLTPMEEGYSRAIPLRFLPAFPPKAVPVEGAQQREWQGGLKVLQWVREKLDELGRSGEPLLALADGSFDTLEMWRGLPERTVLLTRTARNRCLYYLPETEAAPGPGRPPSYGEKAPAPREWLHAGLRRWPTQSVQVRGKAVPMRYQVLGPFVRDGIPQQPLFLIVVKGFHRLLNKPGHHYQHHKPSFFLVSAVQRDDQWELPFPIETLLSWMWQRWEIEVAHREMKSGLGIGEKQCWNPRSAILSVQWSVWTYALLLLAGYRTRGLCGGPPTPARWWSGAKRWSFNTLWRSYRSASWGKTEFRASWSASSDNWLKKEAWLSGLGNACLASARI